MGVAADVAAAVVAVVSVWAPARVNGSVTKPAVTAKPTMMATTERKTAAHRLLVCFESVGALDMAGHLPGGDRAGLHRSRCASVPRRSMVHASVFAWGCQHPQPASWPHLSRSVGKIASYRWAMTEGDRIHWDERYAGIGPAPVTVEGPPLFAAYEHLFPTEGQAMELACGRGRSSVWLARRGLKVWAVDVSEVAIGLARALADQSGVADRCRFDVVDLDGGLPRRSTRRCHPVLFLPRRSA